MFPVAMWFDNDLDILPKRYKETQQTFDRKLPKLPAQHFGDIGLANAKQTCSFDLFQAALFHNRVNLQHQLRLDQMLFGIGKAEVSEDIVASFFIICVAHGFLSLAVCSASRNRIRKRAQILAARSDPNHRLELFAIFRKIGGSRQIKNP